MRRNLLLLLALILPMVGCSQGDGSVYVDLTYPSYIYHHDDYNEKFRYHDSYFSSSAYDFDLNLARASLGLCLTTVDTNTTDEKSEDQIRKFYKTIGFKDVFLSENYSETPTDDSVAYAIAHKKIEEYEVVSIVVRSFTYGQEMSNNFKLGPSGNHQGFDESSPSLTFWLDSSNPWWLPLGPSLKLLDISCP